ncbi:MAG: S41 family peptidase [Bacteroidia bacterium]|nr:S41 family peptidase [Bacteroidia bacterium]MDW8300974.1 S41 family peptidase [Bacteroidia bacterium]
MKSIHKVVIIGLLCFILIGSVGYISILDKTHDNYFQISKNIDIFGKIYRQVNEHYVDEIEPNEFIRIGIDAMLKSLDPYTTYIPQNEIEDYQFLTTGQYGGIGAVIGQRDKKIIITEPYENSPSHKNDIRVGDEILEVNGKSTEGLKTEEVRNMLRGQAGTEVTIKLKRNGQILTKTFKREEIKIKNVRYVGMVSDGIGYITLSGFTQDAAQEVKEAVISLKKQGAKKLILDLRGNPGGLLNQAIMISNLFINKGEVIVSTKGKQEVSNRTYVAENTPLDLEIPIAVLVNENSASASEIVSGVMQDLDRGVVIGQRTYGKGLVQNTLPLSYGAQIKITTAKYYTPSGRCIQKIDYSHKANGKATLIPDSMKKAFKTRNQRVVYDGGGIMPDIEIKPEEYPEIIQALSAYNIFFDFVLKYRETHDKIAPPKDFQVDDNLYNEFVKFALERNFSYNTALENKLKEFRKAAEKEKNYELIKADIDQIESKIRSDKTKDLQTYKSQIKELLELEFAFHYYLESGRIKQSFKYDTEIQEAIKVLNDSTRYCQILNKK